MDSPETTTVSGARQPRQYGCHGFCAAAAHSTAACAGPAVEVGLLGGVVTPPGGAEIAPEQHRPTSSSDRGLCGVSEASHRATHKEVGHGEP